MITTYAITSAIKKAAYFVKDNWQIILTVIGLTVVLISALIIFSYCNSGDHLPPDNTNSNAQTANLIANEANKVAGQANEKAKNANTIEAEANKVKENANQIKNQPLSNFDNSQKNTDDNYCSEFPEDCR